LAVYVEECTVIELEPSPTMKVTARELAEEFSVDAEAASKKYVSKEAYVELMVEGTVAEMIKTKDRLAIARLGGSAGIHVDCVLTGKEWQEIKKGDKVIIKGDFESFNNELKSIKIDTSFVLKKG
jgi:hypothetical protein